jgi:hypothetical protein
MISRRELLIGTGCALGLHGEPSALPGTRELTWEGDLSERMMDGAHQFVERKIAESTALRKRHWNRDFSSREAYEKSVGPNRVRFAHKIGLADQRLTPSMERFGDDVAPALVADAENYRVYQVRWPVLSRSMDTSHLIRMPMQLSSTISATTCHDVGYSLGLPTSIVPHSFVIPAQRKCSVLVWGFLFW